MRRGDTRSDRAAPMFGPWDESHSPWGRMHSRFMASLDLRDQSHIFDLSVRTSAALQLWAERHPAIRAVRVPPLSLSVAAGAPFSSVEALISTARLSLWVFTLDDWFDEQCAPELILRRQAEHFRGLAYQQIPCPTGDLLGPALCEVREVDYSVGRSRIGCARGKHVHPVNAFASIEDHYRRAKLGVGSRW